MRRKSTIFFVLSVGMLAACAQPVSKTPLPVDGSRADGSVVLAFQHNPQIEIPQVDWDAAQRNALSRCNAWGYRNANPFEGVQTTCQAANGYGCLQATTARTYQCTN
ncbi:hypothetical protein DKT77_09105 [Meridianimarinicoccus roseus]|uniref:YecR-like lipoprotein n=1 Tax=Meridianimarinicoccus roseus TaxID=2072018 RepID=A0A2V2LL96_9RHOB|nr:hypothetical protein DKT77_09105 [Meridianimarinicoccus roseus]